MLTDNEEQDYYESPDYIEGVAIKVFKKNSILGENIVYSLPAPNRHEKLRDIISREFGAGSKRIDDSEEGFYSGNKSFMNRKEAMLHVRSIDNDRQLLDEFKNTTETDLQSIHLW